MAELTLEEARNEEPEKKKVTQEEFDKTFLELLGKCTKTVFLDDHGNDCTIPTNRIDLRTSDDKWLFDIQFTGKEHFWFSYEQVLSILKEKYSLQYNEIQRLMKNQVSTRFRIHECTPELCSIWRNSLVNNTEKKICLIYVLNAKVPALLPKRILCSCECFL